MINPLCTLAEFLTFNTSRSQTAQVDAVDDGTIKTLIEGVSRYFEDQCRRTFYPRYETRLYNVPVLQNSPRELFLDDDLLQEVTITNGDKTVITNAVTPIYNTLPYNNWPKYAIKIIGPSSIFWIFSSTNGSIEAVISVEGWWGFRQQYLQRAWAAAGTLNAAMVTTTGLQFTVTAGHTILADTIVKVDNEILNINAIAATTMTANMRGDNGSTAVTHLNGATVYQWMVEPDIKQQVLATVQNMYSSRSGQPTSAGKVTVTAAGVVIRPEDIPTAAQKLIVARTRRQ